MTTQNSKSIFIVPLSLILGLLIVTPELSAQRNREGGREGGRRNRSGISMILNQIDANKNGVLEPTEMRGRTQSFIRDAGLDPNRPQSIQTITKLLEAKGKEKDDKKNAGGTDSSAVRKVPGFGIDVDVAGVSDFSPSGEERMSESAMLQKFGQSVISQVERTLQRYDSNKNGFLDPTEVQRARWSSPSAEESDTNKDGSLSRLEMAYRYKGREDAALKRKSNQSKVLQNMTQVVSRTPSNGRARYESLRNSSKSNVVRAASQSTSANAQRLLKSNKGFNSGNDAYKRYAEGLLKSYDKNNDRRLSKKEMEEMRRPPKGADRNRDGFVDKNELIASVEQRSQSNSGTSYQASSKNNSAADRLAKRRSTSASYNSADSIFGGKDTNNDRQLQMVEFSSEWDDGIVTEFEEIDFNGDGVITEQEWKSK